MEHRLPQNRYVGLFLIGVFEAAQLRHLLAVHAVPEQTVLELGEVHRRVIQNLR